MTPSQSFVYQVIDANGVVSGALAYFRDGRVPGTIFTDKECMVPARNPLKADSLGQLTAYIRNGDAFEVTIRRPDGSFIRQFNSTALPSGVLTSMVIPEASNITQLEGENASVDAPGVNEYNAANFMTETMKEWIAKQYAQTAEIVTKTVHNPEQEKQIDELQTKLADALEKIARLELLQKAAEEAQAKLSEAQAPPVVEDEVQATKQLFDLSKVPEEIINEMVRENVPHGQQQKWLWEKLAGVTNLVMMNQTGPDGQAFHKLQSALHGALYTPKNAAVEVF